VAREEKGASMRNFATTRQRPGAVLTDFRGLSVPISRSFAPPPQERGGVQSRQEHLAKLAVKETDLAVSPPTWRATAVALSRTDPVAASKAVTAWAKGGDLVIKGGSWRDASSDRPRLPIWLPPAARGLAGADGRRVPGAAAGLLQVLSARCGDWPAFSTSPKTKRGRRSRRRAAPTR